MKQTVRTSRTAGYLEKIFRSLNADSFNGELEEPVITIQDTPTAYGHVTVSKAWSVKDEHQRELNIAAGTLQRPIEEVAATMLHEMVHLYNLQHEIQDCSRGGTYHNKKFRDEAQKHMLTIEHHEKYGWTVTKPTEELIDYIINKGWEDIMMNRASFPFSISGGRKGKSTGEDGTETTKPKSNSRKYVCPKCKRSSERHERSMRYAGIAISRLNWKYDRGAKAPLPFSLTESNKYCKIEAAKGINKIFDIVYEI